jgi:hypothetical protein
METTYIALFCVDPGNHTGVAWSYVPLVSSIKGALLGKLAAGSTTLVGPEPDQARELFKLWEAFKSRANAHGIPLDRIELIIERFTLRGGQHAGGRDGTSPERIAWAFEGYRLGRYDTYRRSKHYTPIVWQEPGQALTLGTRPRLESWDCWVKGREHERTAYCHMALRVANLLRVRASARA